MGQHLDRQRLKDNMRSSPVLLGRVYHLALVIIVLVPGGFAVQCFTCNDKEQCPKLSVIYGKNDKKLYDRDNQAFPECSAISSPPPGICAVCQHQTNNSIICAEEVGKLEVESRDGVQISDISSGCSFKFPDEHQQPRSCVGLITSNFFLTVLLGVLLTECNRKPAILH